MIKEEVYLTNEVYDNIYYYPIYISITAKEFKRFDKFLFDISECSDLRINQYNYLLIKYINFLKENNNKLILFELSDNYELYGAITFEKGFFHIKDITSYVYFKKWVRYDNDNNREIIDLYDVFYTYKRTFTCKSEVEKFINKGIDNEL